jgi:hypothetical protein
VATDQRPPPEDDGRSGLTARFVPGVGGSLGELVLEYDGLEPPLALFAELAGAGWTAPVPVPPPADAIDWSRPDPATGKRYSVKPYRAEGRSRPQGRLAFAAEQVGELVDRHRRAEAMREATASTPTERTPSPSIDDGAIAAAVVVATLPPERVEVLLRAHPSVVVVRRTPTTRRVLGSYRGRQSEVVMPAVDVELRVDAATLRTMLRELADVEEVDVHPLA